MIKKHLGIRAGIHHLSLLIALTTCQAATAVELQLTLPAEFYAVVDAEMHLYFAETILAEHPEAYHFEVTCDVGSAEATHWHLLPSASQVGRHPFALTVSDAEGRQLATAATTLVVSPAEAGKDRNVRLLIVGDSLTHGSIYPNEIARLLRRPGNPGLAMLGTHQPGNAAPGVAHEGYGGWTWQRFAEHYEPDPDGTYRKKSSPFVFLDENEQPKLDLPRYFAEHCDSHPPDIVVFKLGINDCFGANSESTESIDKSVDHMFKYADTLLAAFRKAAPQAEFGICLTTPGNVRDEAFAANYQDPARRWRWRRIQHRLVQRQLEHFGNRQGEGLFIIPTELNLDTLAGYPANNAVHPNTVGYVQIGNTVYAWLKHRLAAGN